MWNLAIPCTTGMPHRPSSSDGHTSIFVSSNPIGLRYRLSKCARRFAGLSLATGGFGSAAVPTVSHRRRTVRHGFDRIPTALVSAIAAPSPLYWRTVFGSGGGKVPRPVSTAEQIGRADFGSGWKAG
jgi:hypothetical protein